MADGLQQLHDRIVKVHWPSGEPWYWYLTHQQPHHFSLHGTAQVLPNWPMVKILLADPRPFPGPATPPVGFHSLEAAVLNGFPVMQGYLEQDVPGWAGGLYGLLSRGHYGQLGGGGGRRANTVLGSPMTSPPKWRRENKIAAGIYPDIWTLTKLPHPPLKDPGAPWDFLQNPYLPSRQMAAAAAWRFHDMWKETTEALEAQLWTIHGASTFSIGLTEPPAWPWGCPWINTFQGLQGALSFNAGINASTLSNFPAVGIIYPFPYHIGIGQLDSKNWDTSTFPPRRKV